MINDSISPDTSSVKTPTFLEALRGTGAILGIISTATGLFCAVKIFMLILQILQTPEEAQPFMAMWATALGGEKLIMNFQGMTYDFSPMTAITVVGLGAILLSRLSLALITTGTKVLMWTLGEREVQKKKPRRAFRKNKIHEPGNHLHSA
jgi:hypothetical protein